MVLAFDRLFAHVARQWRHRHHVTATTNFPVVARPRRRGATTIPRAPWLPNMAGARQGVIRIAHVLRDADGGLLPYTFPLAHQVGYCPTSPPSARYHYR